VVIGEGAKRLSPEFRAKYPEVPRKLIAAMRDRVAHSFDEVDLGFVSNVTAIHAPSRIAALDNINPREPGI
jgi:uncharacterized protein with HEPN domain